MSSLPEGWSVVPFEQVADYASGRTPARANATYWNGEGKQFPWVAISDMEPYGIIDTTAETISEAAFHEAFRARIVPAGTLLMSFKLTIGRVATLGVPACHNEAIIAIYPKPTVDQNYLGYFLSQVDYSEQQDRQIKGNTLNQAKIDRIPVVLPPLEEQRAIAQILGRVREGIDIELSADKIASELKRSAMRDLFTRGLRARALKETDLGPLPENWDACRLSDVCALSTGTTPSTKREDYYRGEIPFIKTADIVNNRLRVAATHISEQARSDYNLALYPPGTVLMAMYGQGKTRGQVALLEIAAATTQNAAAIEPGDHVVPSFLWHYLMSIYDDLRGMGSLGHLSHLNLGYLRDLRVPIPPVDEQREMAAILDAVDNKIDLHRSKRDVLEELFRSLLQKLMVGEIRVGQLKLDALARKDSEAA
ncbi:MAG: restriction endonuclease subunit S [Deltaproteobacteria bacterium]|nr:restriction endonuclease subunit S [Deltaproteobacteria bacterium]